MSSDTNDNVHVVHGATEQLKLRPWKRDLDLLANRVCMTVSFICFINKITDVSANNQLAGCKTHKHFLDKLLLYEAPTCDAVLTG